MVLLMNVDILAVVSHPDDETFGCGGTIALHSMQNKKVDVLCLTCNPIERKSEILDAVVELGVHETIVWENQLIMVDSLTIKSISDIIVEKRPEIVITHLPFDYHREHKMTYQVVKEAIEWAGHSTIYEEPWVIKQLLLMEVNTLIPMPHVIVDITETMQKKKNAIKAYHTQLATYSWGYYEKSNIKKAEMRGVQGACEFAEAFLIESIAKNSPFFPNKSIKALV
jgi:LmbE family N-acetylglucosaminyl deacetylase